MGVGRSRSKLAQPIGPQMGMMPQMAQGMGMGMMGMTPQPMMGMPPQAFGMMPFGAQQQQQQVQWVCVLLHVTSMRSPTLSGDANQVPDDVAFDLCFRV